MPPTKKIVTRSVGKKKKKQAEEEEVVVESLKSDAETESENENEAQVLDEENLSNSDKESPPKKQKIEKKSYKPRILPLNKKSPCVVIFDGGEKQLYKSTAIAAIKLKPLPKNLYHIQTFDSFQEAKEFFTAEDKNYFVIVWKGGRKDFIETQKEVDSIVGNVPTSLYEVKVFDSLMKAKSFANSSDAAERIAYSTPQKKTSQGTKVSPEESAHEFQARMSPNPPAQKDQFSDATAHEFQAKMSPNPPTQKDATKPTSPMNVKQQEFLKKLKESKKRENYQYQLLVFRYGGTYAPENNDSIVVAYRLWEPEKQKEYWTWKAQAWHAVFASNRSAEIFSPVVNFFEHGKVNWGWKEACDTPVVQKWHYIKTKGKSGKPPIKVFTHALYRLYPGDTQDEQIMSDAKEIFKEMNSQCGREAYKIQFSTSRSAYITKSLETKQGEYWEQVDPITHKNPLIDHLHSLDEYFTADTIFEIINMIFGFEDDDVRNWDNEVVSWAYGKSLEKGVSLSDMTQNIELITQEKLQQDEAMKL